MRPSDFPYLDDWLVKASSLHRASEAISICLQLFRSLGLAINYQKSVLTPSQRITFFSLSDVGYPPKQGILIHRKVKPYTIAGSQCIPKKICFCPSPQILSLHDVVSHPHGPHARLRMRPFQEQLDRQWLQVTE